MPYQSIAIAVITVTAFLIQSHEHRKERQELYNRIQAGSLEAYVKGVHSTPDPDRPLASGNRIKKVMDRQYSTKRGEQP